MHKTVIALAIAGLAAAPAFADSNVTLYGVVDYGYLIRSGDSGLQKNCASTGAAAAGCAKQEFSSGISTPSRLGFKGAEDLGNGTKAIFELEAGFVANTGDNSIPGAGGTVPESGPVFRRHSWVGLTGDWGTLIGGRVDGARYGVAGRYDPFEHGGVANMGSLQGHVTRGDNAVAFVTPNYEGLYAVLAYSANLVGPEHVFNTGDLRDWIVQPNYVQGPISVTLNYEHITSHNSPINLVIKAYVVGASYDFGVAKLTGYWEHVVTDADVACKEGVNCDENSWMIGTVVPVTESDKIRASYVDYKDKSPAADSCRKWGIGGLHFLSKRTNFYLDFASISQRDKGHCTIYQTPTASSDDAGSASNQTGVGTRGYDLGIVHRF
jgi:predicted porin